MKRIFFALIIISLHYNLFAQTYVKDSETLKAVEFAAILNQTTKTGTYSDQNGRFNLQAKANDTLIISCVGYFTDTLVYSDNIDREILLKPQIYEISEATCNINVKSKKRELGYRKEKIRTNFHSHAGSEWVTYIANNNPKQPKLIKSIVLKTSSKQKNKIAYRLHIYEKDSLTGLPGKDIANIPLIKSNEHKGNKYNLDKDIIFPNSGVFVGIEWVAHLNTCDEDNEIQKGIPLSVPLTFPKEKSYTYYKSKFFDNKWFLVNPEHVLCQLLCEEYPPSLAISIIVKEFYNQ
ncbi:MAG: carboxypeptidase-like regulatory domain-containing protein [Bacteroidales bacterium]|nr:carboxypeptidase-like regulatory domain-containing protein [Bacteroidales bacterium]